MKNGIRRSIPLALMITAVTCWMAPTAVPQQPPPSGTPSVTPTVQLGYSIENAPPEIDTIAEALGIDRIAYVKPALYTRGNADRTVRTFNREKAEQRLAEIAAICDGATWIITDIEKKHRAAVRHPDKYSDAEVKEAVDQYIACWSWFRSRWPDAKVFEWNLVNAREPGRYTLGEQLVLKYLDGFAVSIFYRRKQDWQPVREQVVAHANSLVAGTDKIVIAGIHERHNDHRPGKRNKQAPIPREIVGPMVEVALKADVVMFWSNTFGDRLLPEPLPLTNARVVEMMAEMRLKAAETERSEE